MTPITLTRPDADEVLRYMGTPPDRADEELRRLVEYSAEEIRVCARPRWSALTCAVSLEEGGVRLDSGLMLPGQALRTHLSGCDRAVLFCATLGAGVDELIRRAECTDMLHALTLDCCASAAVEQLCDQIELELQGQFPGCHFPFRFSPGYGDLPLEVNPLILNLLDAPRKVGLCATASSLLTPRKSVTAVLGVADQPIQSHKRSCLGCPAHDGCQYRKAGGHCGIS